MGRDSILGTTLDGFRPDSEKVQSVRNTMCISYNLARYIVVRGCYYCDSSQVGVNSYGSNGGYCCCVTMCTYMSGVKLE